MPISEDQQNIKYSSPVDNFMVVTGDGYTTVYTEPKREVHKTFSWPGVSNDVELEQHHRKVVNDLHTEVTKASEAETQAILDDPDAMAAIAEAETEKTQAKPKA